MAEIIVLIPHFNSYDDLISSLKSIDEEIMVDLMIVDDGSKRSVPSINQLNKVYNKGKIYLEILEKNQGIEFALNRGLELINSMNYEFIGRLDCGDFCRKNRFKTQIEYLHKNPEIHLLGTWANIINDKNENLYLLKHPTSYEEIKNKMFLNSMFVHPSVVFRKSVINTIGFYPIIYKAAEDYAFFFSLIKKYKSENLPEVLLDYVVLDNSISSTKRKLQVKSRIRVILSNFYFGIYPIYGLFRNIFLYFISRNTSNLLKKFLAK